MNILGVLRDGEFAYRCGVEWMDNPYDPLTWWFDWWLFGWTREKLDNIEGKIPKLVDNAATFVNLRAGDYENTKQITHGHP
jgi:hypothetical protein